MLLKLHVWLTEIFQTKIINIQSRFLFKKMLSLFFFSIYSWQLKCSSWRDLYVLALEFRPHPVAPRHQDDGGVRELQRIYRVNGQFRLRHVHHAVRYVNWILAEVRQWYKTGKTWWSNGPRNCSFHLMLLLTPMEKDKIK